MLRTMDQWQIHPEVSSHNTTLGGKAYFANVVEREGCRGAFIDAGAPVNDEGAPVKLGNDRLGPVGTTNYGGDRFYCARYIHVPGTNGQCGPSGGPACPSCERLDADADACDRLNARTTERKILRVRRKAGKQKELFGSALLGQGGVQVPVSSLSNADCVAIYFSAYWCPSCRGFTPGLAEIYTNLKAAGKRFEVPYWQQHCSTGSTPAPHSTRSTAAPHSTRSTPPPHLL